MRGFPALSRQMKTRKVIPIKVKYSCSKCPAYCCSYPEIEVTPRDVERLAKHFDLSYKVAEKRLTKFDAKQNIRLLRHREDNVFDSVCALLDPQTRRCTVYDARPAVCRGYPDSPRCGYYDFLKFERTHQGDPKFIALT